VARFRTWTVTTLATSLLVATQITVANAIPLPAGSADHYAGSEIGKHEGSTRTGHSAPTPDGSVPGMDVSSHQGEVDWAKSWSDGARFAYVKATEGVEYENPKFAQQYNGAYDVGMIRGAYHFALPDRSDGATQANFFVDHGGAWSADGRTLPGALDLEYNPYGDTCYGLDMAAMTAWVKGFNDQMLARTGRFPTIYTSTSWWNRCVGGSVHFGDTNPLWVAQYNDTLDALPVGWEFQTIWQWQAAGTFPGDQNLFNGNPDQLLRVAQG
jgi:GH25 family lysozyme M1 (1,4-beta-N-acetylmuramidase)